jgi:putative acetyltransferase
VEREAVDYAIEEMTPRDLDDAMQLWRRSEGVHVSLGDERAALEAYLRRSPGLSLVARSRGEIVATVLSGHDGRRGYLHHLAVAPSCRRRGIARALVGECLERLRGAGIRRCHAVVFADNEGGRRFWEAIGWTPRPDLCLLTRDLAPPD